MQLHTSQILGLTALIMFSSVNLSSIVCHTSHCCHLIVGNKPSLYIYIYSDVVSHHRMRQNHSYIVFYKVIKAFDQHCIASIVYSYKNTKYSLKNNKPFSRNRTDMSLSVFYSATRKCIPLFIIGISCMNETLYYMYALTNLTTPFC